jgi:lysophospholipase L1-like esterase
MTTIANKEGGYKFLNILIVFIAVLISLIALELYFRIFNPQKLCLNVSQWDRHVGFTNIPNIVAKSITKDYKMTVKINSHGLRDREISYEKPPNTIRIGVFGDSFTFGEGVQNDETYPKILETLLKNEKINGKYNIEVLNFGIGKTGISHQFAFYQKEGEKYNLDIVLVGLLSDFARNIAGVFVLKDGELIHNPTAYSTIRKIQKIVYWLPFYSWLAENSHLVNFIRQVATKIDDKIRVSKGRELNIPDKNKMNITQKEIQITIKLIEEFYNEVKNANALFYLINLPIKGQKDLWDYSGDKDIPTFIIEDKAVLDFMGEKCIPYIDLVPYFTSIDQSLYYFISDGHMNAKGHELIANIIKPDIIALIRKMIPEK